MLLDLGRFTPGSERLGLLLSVGGQHHIREAGLNGLSDLLERLLGLGSRMECACTVRSSSALALGLQVCFDRFTSLFFETMAVSAF